VEGLQLTVRALKGSYQMTDEILFKETLMNIIKRLWTGNFLLWVRK
jgi:hypothetical protein